MLRKLFKILPRKNETSLEKIKLPEINYINLFESMDEGFACCQMIYGKDGKPQDFRYIYVNPAFAKQTGLPLERVLGHTVREVIPKIEQFWIETYARVVESGKSEHFENKVSSIGKTFEIKAWRSGIGYFAVVFEDITERKKSSEESMSRTKELERLSKLQEDTRKALLNVMEDLEKNKALIEIERAKDEAMLASIGEGLIAVDNNRRVMIINKAGEKILGWKSKDIMGRELTSLPLEDEKGNVLPLDKRPTYVAISSGKTVRGTYYFIRKNKTKFPIAIIVTPIKQGRKIIGALDVFRDITYETAVDRAKSEFVSLASHQLRTPLGIMKWYLEALENEDYFKKSPHVVRSYYDEIHKSNERVLSLVGDLLSVSRIDQGRVKNEPKSVDSAKLVKEIVEQMQIVARKKKITLSLTTSAQKIPSIYIDNLRFHEVIENLINNAIDYTESSGTVNVTLKKIDNTLLISVADTGIGISEADQKKLFDKFFRTEKAVDHNPEGSGLGLYVVKSYVEGWGGKITVTSKEGGGSTFTVSLPISQKKKTE